MALENLNSIFNELLDPPDISGRHNGSDENSFLDNTLSLPIIDPSNVKRQLSRISPENLVSGMINIEYPLKEASWQSLYTEGHEPLEDKSPSPRSVDPIQPYLYGGKVDRDNLNIRGVGRRRASMFSPSRGSLIGLGDEPYIISGMPVSDGATGGGRSKNRGGQSIPIFRAVTDTIRLASFLGSPAGLAFIVKQNALGIFGSQSEWAPPPLRGEATTSTIVSPARFGHLYNPLSTLGSSLARVLGSGAQGGVPNVLFRKDWLLGKMGLFIGPIKDGEWDKGRAIHFPQYGDYWDAMKSYSIHSTFGGYMQMSTDKKGPLVDESKYWLTAKGIKYRNTESAEKSGDKMTLANLIYGHKLVGSPGRTQVESKGGTLLAGDEFEVPVEIEQHKNGMPFYFKDLRDDTYIFFRAYIDGLTENVTPNWTSTNYVGRSEPVYTYERGEREVSFNLKLYANTPDEFPIIYKKLNRLTSLCYPAYKEKNSMLRMKPPLTKLRIGDMFGSSNNEMTGFIKSLSYSVPDEALWETELGKRAPRHFIVTISYQIIHGVVPQLKQQVYELFENTDDEGNTSETEEEKTIDYDFYNRTDRSGYNKMYQG